MAVFSPPPTGGFSYRIDATVVLPRVKRKVLVPRLIGELHRNKVFCGRFGALGATGCIDLDEILQSSLFEAASVGFPDNAPLAILRQAAAQSASATCKFVAFRCRCCFVDILLLPYILCVRALYLRTASLPLRALRSQTSTHPKRGHPTHGLGTPPQNVVEGSSKKSL